MPCNYNYAGTELIVIGENKIRCSCGLEVSYQGPLYFYRHTEEVNLRDLTEELKNKHLDWTEAVSLDEELAAVVEREAALAAKLQEKKAEFWSAESEWAKVWAELVLLRKKFDNSQKAAKSE